MTFKELGLSDTIVHGLSSVGLKSPFPIQEQAIPLVLQGKNIMALAKTGSGKTAAYILPLLEKLEKHSKVRGAVGVLILVPTRELALQVDDETARFSSASGITIRHKAVFGGVSINPQMIALKGGSDILIATPGRLLDLISRNAVKLGSVHTVVFDEADRMLDLGFSKDIAKIMALIPLKRQTLLFSATMNKEIEQAALGYYHNSVRIQVESEEVPLDLIEQFVIHTEQKEKSARLIDVLTKHALTQTLVFASMKFHVDHIVKKLIKAGFSAAALHGDKSQGARVSALQGFKDGRIKVLVATDLAARGLDITGLPLVINYELPRSPADYMHRIGRTGRAGQKGRAVSFISPEELSHMKLIEKRMGKTVQVVESL